AALQKVFDDSRATEGQQLQAALLELSVASGSTGADERVTDAWSRIEKVARGQSAAARDALVLLARRALSPQKSEVSGQLSVADLQHALENPPLSKAPQKLLALDLQEHVDASRRDELIAKGITEFKNGDGSDLLTLATWLNGKAEFEKTISAIPLEKALQGRELFLQYLDALGGLGRWNELKQLLENDRYPLDPVVQKMYLARCNAQLGEKTAAENNWQRAIEAAAGDPGKLLSLGDYAEKNGIIDVAKSAYESAAGQSPKLRFAQQGRLRIAQRSGDPKKIHAVLADMAKIWPNDAAVQNDEGYTRLLLMNQQQTSQKSAVSGQKSDVKKENVERPTPNAQPPISEKPITNGQELDQIAQLAAKLVEKNPRSLPHRTFLALARLKQNRAADALAVYDNVTVAANALTPSALAIHACVLAANGRVEEAQSEARRI